MKIFFNKTKLIKYIHYEKDLGFVPTMGALHQGHMALVRRARQENASVIASIFVNPTQFADGEDLDTYPRDLGVDLDVLETEGVDAVFLPNTAEIYPGGYDTWIDVGNIADKLEGRLRKGHFRGVATIVTKLFCVVRPNVGYFGQKDGQQAVIIKQIVRDLNLGVTVRVCPTIREHNGLALSSRNVYLNEKEKLEDNKYLNLIKKNLNDDRSTIISISAEIESQIAQLENEVEKKEFLDSLGWNNSGLDRIIKLSYIKLNLITYFTTGEKETRAWTVKKNSIALNASSVIHTDFKKGFICAETTSFEDYIKYGGSKGAKENGKTRQEGKKYLVKDGDIIRFLFNV